MNTFSTEIDWSIFILGWLLAILIAREGSLALIKVLFKNTQNQVINRLRNKVMVMGQALVTIVMILLFSIAFLEKFGIDIRPLLTSAAIISAVLALAIQTIIKDFVSGIMIKSDNFFTLGDEVEIGNHKGKIIEMRGRTMVLENANQNIYIPNSEVKDVVVKKKASKKITKS